MDFIKEVEEGIKGKYKGLDGGLERFDKYTNRIHHEAMLDSSPPLGACPHSSMI